MDKNRNKINTQKKVRKNIKKNIILSILLRLGSLLFHEDYAIFSLPLIFFFNLLIPKFFYFDIRAMITIYGALILFPAIILDIIFYANNKIDPIFIKLNDNKLNPKLPDILYFKN